MQQTGWSTRKLRLVFGLIGVMLLLTAFVVLRFSLSQNRVGAVPKAEEIEPAAPVAAVPSVDPTQDSPLVLSPVESDPALTLDWLADAPEFVAAEIKDVTIALAEAQAALDTGRLIAPAGDNALERFLGVLEVDPGNEVAQQGIDWVREQVVTEVLALLAERQLDEAARQLPALKMIAIDDDTEMNQLEERLQRLQRAQQLTVVVAQNLAADRLLEPADQNAYARLQQLEALDADHPQLPALWMGLTEGLADRALVAAQAKDFSTADDWLDRARSVVPSDQSYSELSEQILALRNAESDRLVSEVHAAIEAYQFEQAERLIGSYRQLTSDTEQLLRMEERLRLSRIYGNHRPGDVISDALNSTATAPPLVVVPRGRFLMGAPTTDPDRSVAEEPQFSVSFDYGFALGKTEVTVEQFGRFIQASGYLTEAERYGYSHRYHESTGRMSRAKKVTWRDDFRGREADPQAPVLHVSWRDAQVYVNWLAEQTDQPYRLPTEAEFEYALRAGTRAQYWWGEGSPETVVENLTGSDDRSRQRNEWAIAFKNYGDGYWGPAPVGSFAPNPFSLYDMAGNVSEWVEDCWHDSYVRAPNDGSAWVNPGCDRRVARGGYWGGAPAKNRSAYRSGYPAQQRGGSIGFRVARDLLPKSIRLMAQEDTRQ